jgi:hypothetical protein
MDYTEKEKRWESINFAKSIEAKNRYGFTIVFNGTDENVETQKRFAKFSQAYDGVFISAMRVLLDSFDQRQEYDCILEQIDDLELRIAELQEQLDAAKAEPKKEEKKKLKTFGAE